MFSIGDQVRVSEWFVGTLPGVYTIEDIKEDGTCTITGGIDFAPDHLIAITE